MNRFIIKFDSDYFDKGVILVNQYNQKLEVLEKPHRRWYKVLYQYLTFGLYKAPYEYKVKVI